MRTSTVIGVAALGLVVAVAASGKSDKTQAGETWRAVFSINPPVTTSQAALDHLETEFRSSTHMSGVEILDVQFTPNSFSVTAKYKQSAPKPNVGMSMVMGGHTCTLVSFEKD